jgi:hypothetical protein
MPTVRAALETLEASLFVGRDVEVAEFARWLAVEGSHSGILQVIGHAGIGKTALLRAFARMAPALGRGPIAYVDGAAIAPTATDFVTVVTGGGGGEPSTFFGDRPGLLIIDGMEELASLTRWLVTVLIPSLSQSVRVVVAGRQGVGPMWNPARHAMRTIQLESLPREAAVQYLARRGAAAAVADEILGAAGGYPLALSLAADLAVQRGVTRFRKLPEWSLTLRSLVDELLKDAPDLRSLLEAAAVVRQFNEPTLAAVAGLDDAGQAFAELCAMSFVRPSQHGLTLHEDVRRVVTEELTWRNPERLAWLRRQARAYYRDRIRQRRPGEDWMVAERVYLWENTLHGVYFPGGEPWTMWVETGGPDDLDELVAIQREFVSAIEAGVPSVALPPPEECSPEVLRAIVSLAGSEVRIARSPDGRAHGYGFTLPISKEALATLPADGAIAAVVERGLPVHLRRDLPATGDESRVAYMSAAIVRGERATEAVGALAADWFRGALRGGVFLACSGNETAAQVAIALGGVRIPDVGVSSPGPPLPLDGFVFDIGSVGPDLWLEAVTSGLPLPSAWTDERLEKELHQILLGWVDDARLAESPLAPLARLLSPALEMNSPAEELRAVVRRALAEARAGGDADVELPCKALEIAYFERKLSHEAIAARLNVSRTTFYRLVHRAEREVVSRLLAAIRA